MARRHRSGYHNHYNDVGFSRGRITGRSTRETIAALREVGEHVVEAAKAALKEGVDVLVAEAKSRCPVKTGRLRGSIKAEPNRDGTVYQISANASVASTKSPTGRFYYGPVVEFSPKINKPFLYPALEQERNLIYDKVNDAISRAARSL